MEAKQFQAKCYNLKSQLDGFVSLTKRGTITVEAACDAICGMVADEFMPKEKTDPDKF